MKSPSHVTVSWTSIAGGALLLVAAGAGATYLALGSTTQAPALSRQSEAPPSSQLPETADRGTASGPMPAASLPDVVVPLSKEMADRAGVTVAPVTSGSASAELRVPAVVEPNAYKLVVVTPLVGGRITRMAAELGQHVKAGQIVAEIFSPELAEWQTRYVSERAELDAHERELARTEKLVEIGSASRQELERIHAEHISRRAGLESIASRLRLLGISASAIEALGSGQLNSTIAVPAPISGVVTERAANVGLNVDQATKLFTVVDLSTVWVVADLYEKDFARVRVGAAARVTTPAYPSLILQGRVSYIDPQVSTLSRTAKVRVEVPNPRGELRLGMFAEVVIGAGTGQAILVPRSAVQNIRAHSVVYLVNPAKDGEFVEREVDLGPPAGDHVAVLAGIKAGDLVVSGGSFALRAERERLGLRPSTMPGATASGVGRTGETVQTAKITVGEQGYEPARVSLRTGVPARLTFTRITDNTCGTEVVIPSLNIKRALPLNTAVDIEFTPSKAGDVAFVCGLNMFKGTIVVSGP